METKRKAKLTNFQEIPRSIIRMKRREKIRFAFICRFCRRRRKNQNGETTVKLTYHFHTQTHFEAFDLDNLITAHTKHAVYRGTGSGVKRVEQDSEGRERGTKQMKQICTFKMHTESHFGSKKAKPSHAKPSQAKPNGNPTRFSSVHALPLSPVYARVCGFHFAFRPRICSYA